ncbi:hypothetical protein [Roseospira navarrensis]|uniref:Uncharacterized protein n=1 Tax=Roseospira navarrensis TaxID=140058 RepID=A0A7X1ZI62_9PROT|nr:hypothetical protein [Roseospira navarrensis]MQX37907.1 hypothetical protein [Roseospira navarrensis]
MISTACRTTVTATALCAMALALPARAEAPASQPAPALTQAMAQTLAQAPLTLPGLDDAQDRNPQQDLPADAPQCSVPTANCDDFDETAEDLRRRLMDAVAAGDEGNVLADLQDDGLCDAETDALEQALLTMAQDNPEAAAAVVTALVSDALAAADTNGQVAVNLMNVAVVPLEAEAPVEVSLAPDAGIPEDSIMTNELFTQIDEAYQAAEQRATADGCALRDLESIDLALAQAALAGFETAAGGVNPASAPASVFGRGGLRGPSDPGPLPFADPEPASRI